MHTILDVSSIGACRPRIFFINGFLCFLEDEWQRNEERKRERRRHFKEKMSLEEAHHHRRPWIRAWRKEMNEGRGREEHEILCSKRALNFEDCINSYKLFDAHLTPLDQVNNLPKHMKACGLSKNIELVTMQTSVGVFGGEAYTDGISEPLMMENVRYSDHPAVSSLNCPLFIAVELCREQIGVHPVDKRRTVSEYRNIFPAIDFSLDISWEADVKEKTNEVSTRGMKFLEWLRAFGNDCHPDEMQTVFIKVLNRKVVAD
ncbi:Phosphoglycerate mutase-like protein 2 [Glycine max]|nr:Phosphoglycerate mutase-like protein 2 [Glycine max]